MCKCPDGYAPMQESRRRVTWDHDAIPQKLVPKKSPMCMAVCPANLTLLPLSSYDSLYLQALARNGRWIILIGLAGTGGPPLTSWKEQRHSKLELPIRSPFGAVGEIIAAHIEVECMAAFEQECLADCQTDRHLPVG